jgi:hypothetical protein
VIRRAVAAFPEGVAAPVVWADSGFFDAKVVAAAVAAGCDLAIVAKRSMATWAAARAVPDEVVVMEKGTAELRRATSEFRRDGATARRLLGVA